MKNKLGEERNETSRRTYGNVSKMLAGCSLQKSGRILIEDWKVKNCI